MASARRHRERRHARRRRLSLADALTPLDLRVRERIDAEGPLPYREVVELALYDPHDGFYAAHGRAGRRGDFLTSPEVGPLFGHVVANAIDDEWRRQGEPERFVVIDWGAGPGTLLRAIQAAEPDCAPCLELVAVERSAEQRLSHPDGVSSVGELAAGRYAADAGCVIANELLDNLAFDPVRRVEGRLAPQLVGKGRGGEPELRCVDAVGESVIDEEWFSAGIDQAVDQSASAEWLRGALGTLARGRVIVLDYARDHSKDVGIRTYVDHGAGGDPLHALGSKDITVDVDLFQLQARVRSADTVQSQASWLKNHGIERLVAEGQRLWEAGAATGSLEALTGRSRVREAEALIDQTGLGGFTVAEWVI